MSANSVKIEIIPGKVAPRYAGQDVKLLELEEVNITEKGTESDLPIVDFVMRDPSGQRYYFMVTGRIILGIGGTIQGVNQRNHGDPNP